MYSINNLHKLVLSRAEFTAYPHCSRDVLPLSSIVVVLVEHPILEDLEDRESCDTEPRAELFLAVRVYLGNCNIQELTLQGTVGNASGYEILGSPSNSTDAVRYSMEK